MRKRGRERLPRSQGSPHLHGVGGEHVQGHDPRGERDGAREQVRQPLIGDQRAPEGHVERPRVAHERGRQQRIAHQLA